jgi:hypothetical protein
VWLDGNYQKRIYGINYIGESYTLVGANITNKLLIPYLHEKN